jgi:hypothetical protein
MTNPRASHHEYMILPVDADIGLSCSPTDMDGIRVIWLKIFHYTGNGWQRAVNMLSNVWRSIQVASNFLEKPDVMIGPSIPLGADWAALRYSHERL